MNSKISWELRIHDKVFKILAKFPKKERVRLTQIIETLPQDPYFGDIEKMKGEENTWRRRVGDYRIFYELFVDEKSIRVFHVEHRTSKTY